MKIRELREFRKKMFEEIIKIEDVKNTLTGRYIQVYVYDLSYGDKHDVVVVQYETQLRGFMAEHNYKADKTNVRLLYIINKQTKQCY